MMWSSAKDTISPKDPAAEDVAAAEAAEAEEKVKTLEEYLAEKANKSLNVALPEARKANEGADDKKWENAVAFVKEEEPEYFAVNKVCCNVYHFCRRLILICIKGEQVCQKGRWQATQGKGCHWDWATLHRKGCSWW